MVTPSNDPYAPTTPGRPDVGTAGSGSASVPPAASGTPTPRLLGRRLGDYEILETLGEGGMGIVYRARDLSLDREVALKVLQPALAQDEEYERRFDREAKMAAKLDHANIVLVYAAGRCENVLYMAMQLVRGRTLHQVLRERRRLPVAEALGIIRQAAEALDAAHRAGLVHRDIKPNNIMVDDQGRVKIMDFGLMRSRLSGEAITRSGDFFGTPEYASPEQCETSELDGRSDLYSLGAVLYEMLTGRMPHKAETPLALFKKILHEKPVAVRRINPEVSPAVAALVDRMMAKKPSDRFASAGDLIAEIDRVLKGGKAPGSGARPVRIAAASVAVLLALGLTAFGLWPRRAGIHPTTAPIPTVATPVAKSERIRLAVFDLRNGTGEAQSAWYEIALSDLLIASLSQHPSLEIPTRDQMLWKVKEMRLSGPAGEDHRRVLTQELGATAYVSGTYYVRGGKIRVTLAGYRLPDNTPLFPVKTFERGEDDMFALVDEAARSVAKEIEGLPAGAPLLSQAPPMLPCQEVAVAYRSASNRRERGVQEQLAAADRRKDAAKRKEEGAAFAPAEKPGADLSLKEGANPQVDQLAKAGAPGDGNSGRDKAASPAEAKPLLAKAEPAAPPARPASATRAVDEKARKQLSGVDAELAKAWYQNLHALEQCKFDKEEFEALQKSLRGQFEAGGVDAAAWKRGVENFKNGIDRLRDARQKPEAGRASVQVEFSCPGCQAVSPEFGRCAACDQVLILRVKIGGTEKKE